MQLSLQHTENDVMSASLDFAKRTDSSPFYEKYQADEKIIKNLGEWF